MLRFFSGPRFPGSGSHDRSVRIGVSIKSQSPYGVRLVIPRGAWYTYAISQEVATRTQSPLYRLKYYCVGDAEVKVENFERNQEAGQHPQEREECVRRGHNQNLENQYKSIRPSIYQVVRCSR